MTLERYILSSSFNLLHICIDEYKDGQVKGYFYNNTVKEKISFNDINEVFLKADKIFDRNGQPMAYRTMRTFKRSVEEATRYQYKPEVLVDYHDLLNQKGKVLTFDLLVLTRKYSSWQGIIFYNDEEYTFKNDLNLIKILQNSLFM